MKPVSMWIVCGLAAALATADAHGEVADVRTVSLRAGAARVDISPRTLPALMNGGFLQNSSDHLADPLYARALVLNDGRETLAVVIVDSCMLPRDVCDAIKQRAEAATSIRSNRILIAATHTHSAPSAMDMCLGCGRDEAYVSLVTTQVAAAIEQAAAALRPAKVGWAVVDAADLTNCRRWITRSDAMGTDPFGQKTVRAMMHPGYQNPAYTSPAGPIDPWLSVLSVVDAESSAPICLLGNLSMHYFGGGGGFSADYFGEVADLLEQQMGGDTGGPCVGIMSQGTSGDLHWMNYGQPQRAVSRRDYAIDVASRIEEACRRIEHRGDHSLAAAETRLTLRRRLPSAERLTWADTLNRARGDQPPRNQPEVYAQQAAWIHAHPEEEVVLQAMRIGELGLTAIPCEVYGITGLKLKRQSPLAATVNLELANGAAGYIPPPEQHLLGGYTTWPARTAGLEESAEPQIVEAVLGLLEEVSQRPRRAVADPSSAYAEAVLQQEPAAYWRLGDMQAGRATDTCGRHHARFEDGVALFLSGPRGEGFATNDPYGNRAAYLAGGNLAADVHGLTDAASVSLWFCNKLPTDARDQTGALLSLDGVSLAITGLAAGGRAGVLQLSAAGRTAFGVTPLAVGGWHQVTLARDRDRLRVFLDGQEQPEMELDVSVPKGRGVLRVGKAEASSVVFDGLIDEVAVFTRCLDPREVSSLYAVSGMTPPPRPQRARVLAAKPTDATARARYAEAVRKSHPRAYWRLHDAEQAFTGDVRAPMAAVPSTEFSAVYEAGVATADRVAHFHGGRLAVTGERGPVSSVEFWFRNDLPATTRPVTAYLFSHGVDGIDGAAGDNLGIGGTHSQAGRLFLFTGNDDNRLVAGQTRLASGSWAHVVLVRNGKRVRLYLNGDPQPEIDTELASVTPANCHDLFLGGRSDNFANLQGAIEEVAIFDRELTPQEVQTHFQAAGVEPGEVTDAEQETLLGEPLPTDAADALETIHIREGFTVELVAAEPLIADPVAIDWGPDGTLWVAEMADYPLGLDGAGMPGGRVRRLQDTDGDGRYDTSTVFADGLRFPNGILSWGSGVLVTAAPEIVLLEDVDGDGRADVRRVLYSGFQEGNQQLRVNGLRWGLDNWLYCASGSHHAGYGSDSTILSHATGDRVAVGSRDFRIQPDTGAIDPQSGPSQYGRNRDDWGHWFGVQNSHPLWHYVLADHHIRRNPHYAPPDPRWQVVTPANPPVFPASSRQKRYHSFEQSGRFTSACSAMVYRDSLLFPRGRQQHAFTCEPFHNLVQHNLIEADGATFIASRDPAEARLDFFASSDRWCRPVMVRTGPDGGLWVVDMYRFMIEHPDWLPEHGREELRRWFRAGSDRGRIYRVIPAGHQVKGRTHLPGDQPSDLVAALESSNGTVRDMAQRMLVRAGDDGVAPALESMLATSQHPLARLHALCTLAGLGGLSPAVLEAALCDPHPGVRRQAVSIAADLPVKSASLTSLAADEEVGVRLELAATLGAYPGSKAAECLASLLCDPDDRGYLKATAMTSLTPDNVWLVLEAVVERGDEPDGLRGELMAQAIAMGDLDTLERVVMLACHDRAATLAGVLDQLGKRAGAMATLGEHCRQQLTSRIAVARSTVEDPEAHEAERVEAVRLLGREDARRFEDDALLSGLLVPQSPMRLQQAVVDHLAHLGAPQSAEVLLAGWASHSPQLRAQILELLPSRPAWKAVLRERVADGTVGIGELTAAVRQRLLTTGDDTAAWEQLLADARSPAGREGPAAVMEAYRDALTMEGDMTRGERLYRRLCLGCHALGDEGHAVGPQLASMTNKSREAIFTSVLDPNAAVEATYLSYVMLTTDGRQVTGRLASETASNITLLESGGVRHTVLREEIDILQASGRSVMPEGLEQDLSPQDLADLIDFVRVAFTAD